MAAGHGRPGGDEGRVRNGVFFHEAEIGFVIARPAEPAVAIQLGRHGARARLAMTEVLCGHLFKNSSLWIRPCTRLRTPYWLALAPCTMRSTTARSLKRS